MKLCLVSENGRAIRIQEQNDGSVLFEWDNSEGCGFKYGVYIRKSDRKSIAKLFSGEKPKRFTTRYIPATQEWAVRDEECRESIASFKSKTEAEWFAEQKNKDCL